MVAALKAKLYRNVKESCSVDDGKPIEPVSSKVKLTHKAVSLGVET